ncbi:MAG: resolvase [Armatimonadota bacterium]|nr:MAG: resolvase [Armatimonadota bacterium]
MPEAVVFGIDPGRSKVGVAVVQSDGQVLYRAVLAVEELSGELSRLCERFRPQSVVVGGGTGFRSLEPLLRQVLSDVPMQVVNEAFTSEEARRRYLRENPPKGWRRLIPSWLRTPDEPYDDYVAVILAERYWREVSQSEVQS